MYDLFLYGGEIRPEQINLLPFSRHVDLTAYLLNIVLFLPFGFLVPWFCSRMSGAGRVAAGGLGLSLLVELSQLLNNRSTDVDDLLLNTLGALAGLGRLPHPAAVVAPAAPDLAGGDAVGEPAGPLRRAFPALL